ncbi:hypothetical protein CASFOL_038799 [Castilleja foliolosa]|uniref:Uncharacterized protein n=1 Tax=Castilleja foliolosa TaxID=1961234 RepID=A0ABD3BJU1_9LAMI
MCGNDDLMYQSSFFIRLKWRQFLLPWWVLICRKGWNVFHIYRVTYFALIYDAVEEYPLASLGVVGTILDRADAKDALKLGAKFLMSPAMVKDILDDVAEGQALYIPGATTPTENCCCFAPSSTPTRDNRANIRECGTSALFILEYDVVSEMIPNGKELEYKWDSDLSQLFLLKELDSSLRDEKDHCLEETE